MTREQIVVEFVLGLVLIIVGIVLQPLLKKLWERMNRPSPLDAKTKGQLVTSLTMAEDSLKRLDYLNTHPKDLFLYLIQLVLATLLFSILAFCVYLFSRFLPETPSYIPIAMLLLGLAIVFGILGLVEAGRMSEKKIAGTRQGIQNTIDNLNERLSGGRLLSTPGATPGPTDKTSDDNRTP